MPTLNLSNDLSNDLSDDLSDSLPAPHSKTHSTIAKLSRDCLTPERPRPHHQTHHQPSRNRLKRQTHHHRFHRRGLQCSPPETRHPHMKTHTQKKDILTQTLTHLHKHSHTHTNLASPIPPWGGSAALPLRREPSQTHHHKHTEPAGSVRTPSLNPSMGGFVESQVSRLASTDHPFHPPFGLGVKVQAPDQPPPQRNRHKYSG